MLRDRMSNRRWGIMKEMGELEYERRKRQEEEEWRAREEERLTREKEMYGWWKLTRGW